MTTEGAASFNKLFQMYSVMAKVVRASDLTPRMRRVTLGGEALRSLVGECLPADAIKLYLPEPGDAALPAKFLMLPGRRKPVNVRAYTIRHFRAETLELDLDILLHGDSPGSVWARTVQPGEQIGFIGPRHDYRGAPNAEWQVLAGDESALPAIAAILESLPEEARAHAFIEVHDQADEVPLEVRADVNLTWLHRGDAPAKDSTLLEAALKAFSLPNEKGYCWVAGNSRVVKSIRKHLTDEWHFTKDQMFTMGYWN